jgi:hypothetical protein
MSFQHSGSVGLVAGESMSIDHGFTQIGETLPGVLKEISRRAESRLRLEAEWGRPLTDQEFLKIAEENGVRL